jgi:rhamnogalacturonyl hydrolase YesR
VKIPPYGFCRLASSVVLGLAAFAVSGAAQASPDASPSAVLGIMQRVADWQLAHPSAHRPTDWTQGAGSTGMMALAGISGNTKYRDAERAVGSALEWQLGPKIYHADDHCIGQTYAELYLLFREKAMIDPLKARFDGILAAPSKVESLSFVKTTGEPTENWSWCDALFMGPPTWMRLYAATGDTRYMDFAVRNWWRTSDYLYDKDEHLFFRDSTYFGKQEANGKKVFWSRGNGWVMAGLARTLQYLPTNHPDRPRFEKQFTDMAEKILTCQQPDGMWRASLLDPASYPLKETSGSGFYVYALAWGVNQGLLDRTRFLPAVKAGWNALTSCVDADGKLTHVQPIGADPKKFAEDATEVYGVGAFVLAGSEVYRNAVLEAATGKMTVTAANPAPFRRENETIELLRGSHARLPEHPVVIDGLSSRVVDSQTYASDSGSAWDTLVFQVDLAPGESRSYQIVDASVLAAVPHPIVKTYARQVTERFNDMAWESDRTAHRTYQVALIKGEGTITSGIDVWSKRTRQLIVDELYANKDYHNDHGHGLDDYHVSKSRGCGGLGIWDGTKLYVSLNYKDGRVITTGPVRSVFELTYDAWDAAGRKFSEVKRISIDAGSNMCRASSVFSSDDPSAFTVGIGIAGRPGDGGDLVRDEANGLMAYWQPTDRDRGNIACAVVVPGTVEGFVSEKGTLPSWTPVQIATAGSEGYPPVSNELTLVKGAVGTPLVYYFGAGWSKSGDFPEAKDWENYVRQFGERLKAPLSVTLGL